MLGLGSIVGKASGALSSFVKDGLKLYMPYSSSKEVKFVGQGSTAFDSGSNNYIDCGTDSSLTVGTSDFSACAWVKLSSKGGSDYHDIVARGNTLSTGNGWGLNFNENDNKIWFDIGNTSEDHRDTLVSGSNAWEYNKWHHVVVSRVNSTNMMNMYLDGVLIASGANNDVDDIGDSSSSFGIGKSDNPRYANGNIKNVGFWKRALSDTEVQNVMHKTWYELSGTLKQGLSSWWALDDIDSYSVSDLSATQAVHVIDLVGNNTVINGWASTGATFQTELYGGTTPLIPRGVDNAPVVQADAIGTGYATFNNANSDYINFGSDSTLDVGTSDFSACCWFKLEDTSGHHDIMGKCASSLAGNTEGWSVAFLESDKTIRFEVGETTGKDDAQSSAISYGRWYHVAVTRNNSGNSMKIYIDGVFHQEEASHTADTLDDGDRSFRIGGFSSPRYLKGNVKNVGFWKGAVLTQQQIQSIMEKTYSELTSSEKEYLTSWWGLDSIVAPIVGDTPALVEDEHDTTLGSDVVVNGGFDTDSTWAKGTGWTISGGTASSDGTQSDYSNLDQTSILTVGQVYKVQFNITEISAGHLRPSIQTSTTVLGDNYTTSGVKTWYVKATGTDLKLQANADFIGSIDDVSVKPFDGNYGELR